MAFLEQPDSLYNKTIIAYTTDLITKEPFRKNIIQFLNICVLRGSEHDWQLNKFRAEKIDYNIEIMIIGEDVEDLNLPLNIKLDVKSRLFPICHEIKAWMEHYRSLSQCYELSKILDSLCWTCAGVINVDKTWKKFVIDDTIFNKYRHACYNCREEDIRMFWNGRTFKYSELSDGNRINLVTFWNYYMSNRLYELIDDGRSENVFGLHIALKQGNASVVKYFWNKLTPEEKEDNIIRCFKTIMRSLMRFRLHIMPRLDTSRCKCTPRSSTISNVYFFLKEMSNETVRKIFDDDTINYAFNLLDYPYSILEGFTDFPFRHLFISVMEYLLTFIDLSQIDYLRLLTKIALKLVSDPKTYSKLLLYIWNNKIYDKNHERMNFYWRIIMKALLAAESYGNILLIFNNISAEAKEIFFEDYGSAFSYDLINQNKFDIFELLMKIFLTNKDAALRFKNYQTVAEKLRISLRRKFRRILNRFIISFGD